MNFDVIIGNPPYQENTGDGCAAKAIYQNFIRMAWKISTDGTIAFIIPARWFTGGQGLGYFTHEMLNNKHIKQITFYPNSKDVFPNNSIAGGVVHYTEIRDKEFELIKYRVVANGAENTVDRVLNSYDVFIRDNLAINILDKVETLNTLDSVVGPVMQYNIQTYYRGTEKGDGTKKCMTSAGVFDYESDESVDSYRVFISTITNEHANEPGPDGKYKVIGKSGVLEPDVFCTASYITIGEYGDMDDANKMLKWVQSKLVRCILLQFMVGIHITKKTFRYVPMLPDEYDVSWSDDDIFNYYSLSSDEVDYINNLIREY